MDLPLSGGPRETGLVVGAFQTAGALLVALLLRLLARSTPDRFVTHWSLAWAFLAAALVSLNLWLLPGADWAHRPALAAHCGFEYLFGFYLWVGCRAFARGVGPARSDVRLLAPVVAFGVLGPLLLPDPRLVFPVHAAVLCGFCLLALLATLRARPEARQTAVGLWLVQAALVGLVALFGHHAAAGWASGGNPDRPFSTLHHSALFDGLVQTLLAFGAVVIGTDAVRRALEAANRELAETNRKLTEASEQLAVAARTDPLTGLLNRRAYDALLADRAARPFAGSVAVIDLNDLKPINDAHGHAAGDAAIRHVARALQSHFRITDAVFRIGGDEFLAVLEGGRAAELAGRLEAVDAALQGVRLPGVADPVDLVIAWGLADFDAPDQIPAAVARADAAMYECKARRKAAA
jgi:diguanylate cyclase (GGDEF)-like protein